MDGAIDAWSAIGLDAQRETLKTERLEMVARAEASKASRKNIAEETRTFRKKPVEEQLASIKGVVKLYQKEIDTLTKRAAFAEDKFLGVFTTLFTAPDPAPLLVAEHAKSARRELKLAALAKKQGGGAAELSALRAQVAQYEAELTKLKDQTITIRRLEDELEEAEARVTDGSEALAAQLEAVADAQHAQTAAALTAEHEEVSKAHAERAAADAARLREASDEAVRLEAQLNASVAHAERDSAAHNAELTMMASEVERLGAQLEMSEAERHTLAARLERSGERERGEGIDERHALAMSLEDAELRALSLQAAQKQQVAELIAAKRAAESEARVATREREAARAELALLRSRANADEVTDAVHARRLARRLRIVKQLLLSDIGRDATANEELALVSAEMLPLHFIRILLTI